MTQEIKKEVIRKEYARGGSWSDLDKLKGMNYNGFNKKIVEVKEEPEGYYTVYYVQTFDETWINIFAFITVVIMFIIIYLIFGDYIKTWW